MLSGCITAKFSAVVKALVSAAFPHETPRMYSDDKDCLSLGLRSSSLLFSLLLYFIFYLFLFLLSLLFIHFMLKPCLRI